MSHMTTLVSSDFSLASDRFVRLASDRLVRLASTGSFAWRWTCSNHYRPTIAVAAAQTGSGN